MKKGGTGMQINSKEQETKLIIVTREDISTGYQAQQSTHSVAYFAIKHANLLKDWDQKSGSIICLGISSEEALLKLQNKLHHHDVESVLFQEPDLENQYTSLCFYADYSARKLVSNLSLLGKNKKVSNDTQIVMQNK